MDAGALRQVANGLARAAGELTQRAFDAGREMERLQAELATLREAADICRNLARVIEAREAQQDDSKPLCLGCKHRRDSAVGFTCELGMDTREASTKRSCKRYDAE